MNKPVMLPWAQAVWQRTDAKVAAWTAHALPPPAIDADDRTPYDAGALVSLAVALDVLSTRTRALDQGEDDPQVLARLTQITWEVGAQGAEQQASPERLLRLAESGAASERARISQAMCNELAKHASAAGAPATPGLTLGPASAPETVLASARRLQSAAKHVVQEACLNLATRSILDYRAI